MFRVIPLQFGNKSLVRFTVTKPSAWKIVQACSAHSAAPTATGHHDVAPHKFNRIDFYPRIGNREFVGYGRNGDPSYFDAPDCPCPSVRWKEDTDEIRKLREKAKGDWSALSIAEKKALYRADFRSTLAEETAPTGEWKFTVGLLLGLIGGSIWLYYFYAKMTYDYPMLESSSLEHQYRMLERMIAMGVGRVHGIGSEWDYEKGDWKKNTK